MSRAATKIKPTYELSTEVVGKQQDQRATRELRKGLPDEYKELLAKATTETNAMVEQALAKTSSPLYKAARLFVPKLYDVLTKHDYPAKNARVIITEDCRNLWTERHVLRWIPKSAKNIERSKAGDESGRSRGRKRDEKNKQAIEVLKPIFPKIEEEDEKTQAAAIKMTTGMGSPKVTDAIKKFVATSGGEGKRDKYGNEVFSDMGKKSAEVRQGTYKLAINREEHKEMVTAYEESMEAGAGGKYFIFIKDHEYERVEPDLNGDAEKTVNR